jgi:hypothetical protein
MKILLATPYMSQHYDSGLFWARALSRLGHELVLWDYRLDKELHLSPWMYDLGIMLKGTTNAARQLMYRCDKTISYWPDALGRDKTSEKCLRHFDLVFWFPGAYDEQVHQRHNIAKSSSRKRGKQEGGSVFIGTHTQRKEMFLMEIQPTLIFGNGWNGPHAVYLHEYVNILSGAQVSVNIHRDNIGLNRRFFESIACAFTITDRVPGVEEVLGSSLADLVSFETPQQGREMLEYYLDKPDMCKEIHALELDAIREYSYSHLVKKILDEVNT